MIVVRKLHKWLGLLIGMQVLIWVCSGLVISLLDPLKVSGMLWANPVLPQTDRIPPQKLLEPHQLSEVHLAEALSISLESNRGSPVYRIAYNRGEVLLDAINGSIITINRSDAEKLAKQDFTGDGKVISVEQGTAPNLETRSSFGDYWRVSFSDTANTTLYVSSSSGEIIARRNNYWRVRDFFWMMHIMDYRDRQDFNNSLVIIVALISVWIGISGLVLLFGVFGRHDFYFFNIFRKTDKVVITLANPMANITHRVKLRKNSNLFVSLAANNVKLPSICGGGGRCGLCIVKVEMARLPEANTSEMAMIPKHLLDQGFRLACQLKTKKNMKLQLPDDN